jgi:ubiquinone/menaquinone biosynthesis C-methylase UbiE
VKLAKADAKKSLIKQSYNQSALYYDRRYLKIQFRKLLHIFAQHPLLNIPILDFGCGSGVAWDFLIASNAGYDLPGFVQENIENWIDNWTKKTSKKKKQLNLLPNCLVPYVGIDLSFRMLQIFHQKSLHSHNTHIQLVCADGEHLPFRASQFRTVLSLTTLQNLPEPKQGISEIIRVKDKDAGVLISYLKKSITKPNFITLMQGSFIRFQEINPIESDGLVELEDWLCIVN